MGVLQGRLRRAAVLAALLLAAAVVVAVQFSRLDRGVPPALSPDAPPAGVPVFYVRDPGNPHGLIAYDWGGARRGSVRLPTWVQISRLIPAPDGSAFLLDPSTPGDYAAYFDSGGRTLAETDDAGFMSQAWADDSTHVCVLSDNGNGTMVVTRLPGQSDRTVLTQLSGGSTVAGCSLRTDTILIAGSNELDVVRLSSGRVGGRLPFGGTLVASTDASYVALGSNGVDTVPVYKTSDLSRPVALLDAGMQPMAFSGDDSLLLASRSGGPLEAIAWRTGKTAWTYDAAQSDVGFSVTRPSSGDFVLYMATAVVLLHADGRKAQFG